MPALDTGQARLIGEVVLEIPAVSEASERKLEARLIDRAGRTLSENWEPVWLFPKRERVSSKISFASVVLPALTQRVLRVLGYQLVPLEEKPQVVLAGAVDPVLERYAKDGGTVILLPQSNDAFLPKRGLKLVDQHLGGHTSMFYARKDAGVFDGIPFANPYTWQFHRVWPKLAIEGIKPEQHRDVLAGEYMNLLNRQCGSLVQYRCGKGRVLVCLLGVLDAAHDDPVAMILTNNLLRYAASDFQPQAELAD